MAAAYLQSLSSLQRAALSLRYRPIRKPLQHSESVIMRIIADIPEAERRQLSRRSVLKATVDRQWLSVPAMGRV